MDKVLVIDAPYFCAAAIWRKTGDGWECYRAAPIIHYLIGMSPEDAKRYIAKKKWQFFWLPLN